MRDKLPEVLHNVAELDKTVEWETSGVSPPLSISPRMARHLRTNFYHLLAANRLGG